MNRDDELVGSRFAGNVIDACAAGSVSAGAGGEVVAGGTVVDRLLKRSTPCDVAVADSGGGPHMETGHLLLMGSLRVKQKRHAAHCPSRLQ